MKTTPSKVFAGIFCLIFSAATLALPAWSAYSQDLPPTISVNFSGGGGADDNRGGGPYQYNIESTAGVVPSPIWNNLPSSSGNSIPLVDQTGNLAGAITYKASAISTNNINWNMGVSTSSITDPNRGIYNDFLNYFWSDGGGEVCLSGLGKAFTEHGYSIIVYFSNPDPQTAQKYVGTSGNVTSTRWALTNNGTTLSGFVESLGTDENSAQPGNYVILNGFSESTVRLHGGDYYGSNHKRPALAGFQVVANMPPAISVNFSGGGGQDDNKSGGPYQYDVHSVAGATPRNNWNNLVNSSGTAITLYDNLGGSAATVTYQASANSSLNINWHMDVYGTSINDPNRGLYNDFLNYFWADQGGAITISGLGPEYTTNGYSVKVYFSNPDASAKQCYQITSGTTSVERWALTDSATTLPTFVESRGTDANSAKLGNYVTLRGLTNSSFTLRGAGNRPALAAFQVIAEDPIYVYTLQQPWGTVAAFDEAVAVTSIQGIVNRNSPKLYVLAHPQSPQFPQYWLNKLSRDGRWLEGRRQIPINSFEDLARFAMNNGVQGSVVWDENVPATLNVALTAAGVENLAVFSPSYVASSAYLIPLHRDLRGQFTGTSEVNYNGIHFSTTGSAKNDAYRWAIHLYLNTGWASALCAFRSNDAWYDRPHGTLTYATTYDWAVKNRSFVYDLSPWGDEAPNDEPSAPVGTDLETHKMILQGLRNLAGQDELPEIVGWFDYQKYTKYGNPAGLHDDFLTEQEETWLISKYGCYGNGVPNGAYNQSFHCHAPREQLSQKSAIRAAEAAQNASASYDSSKIYICVLMGDYDSSGWLYTMLPTYWEDSGRGTCPLTWAINPNLVEIYPDIVQYCYDTAKETSNGYDMFAPDANCAGYIMPNWLPSELLPLFTRHNQHFFEETDMTIAPMVTDTDQPSTAVKNSFAQFATEGYGALVWDPNHHTSMASLVTPHVWGGMMVFNVVNDISSYQDKNAWQLAAGMSATMQKPEYLSQKFFCFRIAFVKPTEVAGAIPILRQQYPNVELVDMHTFLALHKRSLAP